MQQQTGVIPQNQNTVALTQAALAAAPSVKAVLELPEVESNWIKTYRQVTGREDGAQKFYAEKILFMQATSANGFKNVDRFSLYSCFIELAISGLTLRDGIAYVVPYNKTASFIPGWKGRLEQINEMPDVVYVHEPQVVREDDIFEFELGMSPKIIKHVPKEGSTSRRTYVYLIVEFTHGPRVYMMSAAECYNIRDRFSQSYKQYVGDCQRANQPIGATFQKTITGNNGAWEATVEPPMWLSDETQAFKKTIVKRTYNVLPKLAKHKHLDNRAKEVMGENFNLEHNGGEDFNQYSNIPAGGAEEYEKAAERIVNNGNQGGGGLDEQPLQAF